MKLQPPVLVFVYDKINDFYTFSKLSAGPNFNTMTPMDPQLGEQISHFLQISKLLEPNKNFETDINKYSFFSWDLDVLGSDSLFSTIANPRILLAINSEEAIADAYGLKIHLESMDKPKTIIDEWINEVDNINADNSRSSVITGGVFINSPIMSPHALIKSHIDKISLNDDSAKHNQKLNDLVMQLRNEIEQANGLKDYEKSSAQTDLSKVVDQLNKPSSEKTSETIDFYLKRLNSIAQKSSTLVNTIVLLTQMLGVS